MNREMVNVSDLVKENGIADFFDKNIESETALKDRIESQGFRDPILVSKENNIVIDGYKRLAIAKILNYKQVPVVRTPCHDDTSKARMNLAILEQVTRRNISQGELMKMAKFYFDNHEFVPPGDGGSLNFMIARHLITSQRTIGRIKRILDDADPSIIESIKAGDLSFAAADKLISEKPVTQSSLAVERSTPVVCSQSEALSESPEAPEPPEPISSQKVPKYREVKEMTIKIPFKALIALLSSVKGLEIEKDETISIDFLSLRSIIDPVAYKNALENSEFEEEAVISMQLLLELIDKSKDPLGVIETIDKENVHFIDEYRDSWFRETLKKEAEVRVLEGNEIP